MRPTERALTWHLLIEPDGRPGAENMAVDEALLDESDRTGGAFLRLYRFSPPCLSLGRNEPARARYDRAAITRLGITVVRRPTGGRAVWHEHEVTYAVAAPLAALGEGSVRDSSVAIHRRLAAALRSLGVAATLAPRARAPGLGAGACFAALVGGEVVVDGQKVIGSAQVRLGGGRAFLQHGSILLGGSQDLLTAVSRETAVSRQPQAASGTTLSAALERPVTFHEVVDAIIAAWDAPLTSTALYRPLPSSTAQFSDPAWTWRR
ncbi:MAG: hypothetical protein DMD36_01150 [Gemmatimonadetes bacterium]|nr:MAG: hypothetical protein DMD36_01150 [Gemmatimonadota bacterium]